MSTYVDSLLGRISPKPTAQESAFGQWYSGRTGKAVVEFDRLDTDAQDVLMREFCKDFGLTSGRRSFAWEEEPQSRLVEGWWVSVGLAIALLTVVTAAILFHPKEQPNRDRERAIDRVK